MHKDHLLPTSLLIPDKTNVKNSIETNWTHGSRRSDRLTFPVYKVKNGRLRDELNPIVMDTFMREVRPQPSFLKSPVLYSRLATWNECHKADHGDQFRKVFHSSYHIDAIQTLLQPFGLHAV